MNDLFFVSFCSRSLFTLLKSTTNSSDDRMWWVSLTRGVRVLRYIFPLCSQTERVQAFQASAELKIIPSPRSAVLRCRLASGVQTAVTKEASVITAMMTLMLSSGNRLPEKESNRHSSVVPRLAEYWDHSGVYRWILTGGLTTMNAVKWQEFWQSFDTYSPSCFFIPGNHFLSSCRRVPASFHLSLNPSPFLLLSSFSSPPRHISAVC